MKRIIIATMLIVLAVYGWSAAGLTSHTEALLDALLLELDTDADGSAEDESLTFTDVTTTDDVTVGDDLVVTGTVSIGGLPEYADNAAALLGGLEAGDAYTTATGQLMITYAAE